MFRHKLDISCVLCSVDSDCGLDLALIMSDFNLDNCVCFFLKLPDRNQFHMVD